MTNEFAIALLKQDIQNSKINISYRHNEVGIKALELAIKALEQQPREDYISRAEALKAIENEKQGWELGETRYAIDECHTRIAELPSVTPQQTRWIPVKWHIKTEVEEYEQYPEGVVMLDCPMPAEGEDVLITIKGKSGQVWVEKDTALKDEDGWYTDGGYEWVDDIIAWMPLPEGYKESKQ